MAFRLRIDEPIEKAFRRAGVEQIERARRELTAARNAPATAVHEVRKCLKRIRALLRLARVGLGDAVFRAENAHFRAIAASLSTARDDQVLLETVVKLASEHGATAGPALGRLKQAVLARRNGAADDSTAEFSDAEAALDRAARRFRRLRIDPNTFATLEKGLVRNYRKGIAERDRAYAEETDEAFHEWRKCVQTHWRHMALLSRAWPAQFEAHIQGARELSQLLGDDHDLAMLRDTLATLPADALSREDAETIRALVRAHQTALRGAARSHGLMLYAERPKAHGRRIAAIWAAAVHRADEEDREEEAPARRARARQLATHARN
ncbi:MAG: CHAD domain-containing protein [Hyphomicrobium sp.]|uniref:CHAD domain-containing protein n=1 Tax=Hyphomicrobium sp. TaxID=82 RepID=UPI003D1348DC